MRPPCPCQRKVLSEQAVPTALFFRTFLSSLWPAPRPPIHTAIPHPSVIAPPDVTRLLHDARSGAEGAHDRLLATVYQELNVIARAHLRRERPDHTLSSTALVHEAYVRMVDLTAVSWTGRAHFFAVASQAMRRVLVDWARARRADKRGGDAAPLSLDAAEIDPAAPARPDEIVALDEALRRLACRSERQARVVECRYFGGLSIEETAGALGVSPTTVKDDWRLARAWLFREMRDQPV